MRKNIASQLVSAQLLSATDGSDITTGVVTVEVTIDSNTQTTGTGTISHEGNGLWNYTPTQAETNGNHIVFTFKHGNAITTSIQVYTISFDPHDVASLGLTNVDTTISSRSDFNASSDAVANVTLVDTVTSNTDMRGTDSALLDSNYVSPDNTSIAAILTDTSTTIPNQINSLNDFNPSTDTVANVTTVTSGVTVTTNNDKTGYSISQVFPTNFENLDIDNSGNVNSFTQGYLSTAITETSVGNISANFDVFFDNSDSITTKVVDDVGTAVSGGGEFTATEKSQLRYRLGIDGTTVTPTADPDLSQKSDINSLNDFDAANDVVAHVTLVDTTTTNTDMRGTDNSLLATNYNDAPTVSSIVDGVWDEVQSNHTTVGTYGYYLDSRVSASGGGGGSGTTPAEIWSYADRELTSGNNIALAKGTGVTGFNDIEATDIVTGGAIDTTSGAIDNVSLVNTTTSNTDMRGTNDAMLASAYVAPSNASIATILSNTSTSIPNQISGLNDLSASEVWTTQLVESYAADGVAPTATQTLMLTQQFLTEFDITGTSYNVKRLDGSNTAATFTLNDDSEPTSITRS